jgi:hypothetical protein
MTLAAMASLPNGGGSNGINAVAIMSLALTAAAKMPLPLPPLAAAYIGNDCYHSR